MWWMLAREVLRMRGTISREHPWEVMPDLYFYRDPEEVNVQLKDVMNVGSTSLKPCLTSFCRSRRRSRLQLRRLLVRRSSRVNGALLLRSLSSLRWPTGLKVWLCHLCPSSSSLQVRSSACLSYLLASIKFSSLFYSCCTCQDW